MVLILLLVVCCGLGAVLRALLAKYNKSFPLGTLLANILGCFLIGLCYRYIDKTPLYTILATGFCGGLTTYSTLHAEVIVLRHSLKKFLSYLIMSYVFGMLALLLGKII